MLNILVDGDIYKHTGIIYVCVRAHSGRRRRMEVEVRGGRGEGFEEKMEFHFKKLDTYIFTLY
jgi:hypothetical protein